MRKLVYIGTNGTETFKTGSYKEMVEKKAQGFSFKEELEDVIPKRDYSRAKKLEEIAKEKEKKA